MVGNGRLINALGEVNVYQVTEKLLASNNIQTASYTHTTHAQLFDVT